MNVVRYWLVGTAKGFLEVITQAMPHLDYEPWMGWMLLCAFGLAEIFYRAVLWEEKRLVFWPTVEGKIRSEVGGGPTEGDYWHSVEQHLTDLEKKNGHFHAPTFGLPALATAAFLIGAVYGDFSGSTHLWLYGLANVTAFVVVLLVRYWLASLRQSRAI